MESSLFTLVESLGFKKQIKREFDFVGNVGNNKTLSPAVNEIIVDVFPKGERFTEQQLLELTNWINENNYQIWAREDNKLYNYDWAGFNISGMNKGIGKTWIYNLTQRPFGIGTYPTEGFIELIENPDITPYGQLKYSKRLSTHDISNFELSPVTELEEATGNIYKSEFGGKSSYFVPVFFYHNRGKSQMRVFESSGGYDNWRGYDFLIQLQNGDFEEVTDNFPEDAPIIKNLAIQISNILKKPTNIGATMLKSSALPASTKLLDSLIESLKINIEGLPVEDNLSANKFTVTNLTDSQQGLDLNECYSEWRNMNTEQDLTEWDKKWGTKRYGTYDTNTLFDWAKSYKDFLSIPEAPSGFIRALKKAIKKYDHKDYRVEQTPTINNDMRPIEYILLYLDWLLSLPYELRSKELNALRKRPNSTSFTKWIEKNHPNKTAFTGRNYDLMNTFLVKDEDRQIKLVNEYHDSLGLKHIKKNQPIRLIEANTSELEVLPSVVEVLESKGRDEAFLYNNRIEGLHSKEQYNVNHKYILENSASGFEKSGIRKENLIIGSIPKTEEKMAKLDPITELRKVASFIPQEQLRFIEELAKGEESQFFAEKAKELSETINKIPTYTGNDKDPMVLLHYFRGASDWWITEISENKNGYIIAFGFVCMDGYYQDADLGTIFICVPNNENEEAKANSLCNLPVEIDLHWNPKRLSEVKDELFGTKSTLDKDIIQEELPEEKKQATPEINTTSAIKKGTDITKVVRGLIDEKGDDRNNYSQQDILLLRAYEGLGAKRNDKEYLASLGIGNYQGIRYEYYTPLDIIKKMWGLAYKHGYKPSESNVILEPSCGTGRFYNYIENVEKQKVIGFDIDRYALTITKLLYPFVILNEESFATGYKSVGRVVDLVIGNPPYDTLRNKEDKKATKASTIDQLFLMRSAQLLKKDGLMIFIVPNSFMNNDTNYNGFKQKLTDLVDLVDAYRLPNKSFAKTDIGTDILVFKRK